MEFAEELIKGKIVDNYKDIILDVKLDGGSVVSAFCSKHTYMEDVYVKGADVYVSLSKDERKRLKYECQIVNKGDGMVFVNPMYNEAIFIEGIKKGMIDEFKDFSSVRRIKPDLSMKCSYFELAKKGGDKMFVYLDNIYNKQDGNAVFPSDLNAMEIRLLEELRAKRREGYDTAVFEIVPRPDCANVKFSWLINQIAAAKIYDETEDGLKFICYGCNVSQYEVAISRKMDVLY